MPIANLADKTCLITGAASGIGRAVALAAAQRGAVLYLTDRSEAALGALVETIRASGRGRVALHQAFDITDLAAVRAFADAVHTQTDAVDVVMNIAGIAIWGPVEKLEHRHWQRAIDVNLMGPIHVIECFVPNMVRARRGGHLVNVSSAAGLFGLPWHGPYSASKFGLRGISEVLRFDLARHRIGVSLVCPGAVNTGLVNTVEVVGVDMDTPEARKLKGLFVKHAVPPERAAEAILRAVATGRYLVFTSPDIRLGHWFQRKLAWPYEWVMRLMNDRFQRVLRRP
jgi:NAD(P)-dependent dehydrogenase (short-subunit alcohol dehydrogenase family)